MAFEKLYTAEGTLLGSHEDLEDPDQTVKVNPEKPKGVPNMGDTGSLLLPAAAMGLSAMGVGGLLIATRGKKKEEE